MEIIGLNGKKRSGKDTIGAHLVETHGYTRISFAALLKESAAALFGIDPAEWDTLKDDPRVTITLHFPGTREDIILTAREFLQRYGTEAHRDIFGLDFWVDNAVQLLGEGSKYVITDARFDNELALIQRMGGRNWRVQRDTVLGPDTHASEADPPADLIDQVIENDGSIADLLEAVDFLLVKENVWYG